MRTSGQQQTSVALPGKVLLDQQEIIGIIKDQQPVLLALFKPTDNRRDEFALVFLFLYCN